MPFWKCGVKRRPRAIVTCDMISSAFEEAEVKEQTWSPLQYIPLRDLKLTSLRRGNSSANLPESNATLELDCWAPHLSNNRLRKGPSVCSWGVSKHWFRSLYLLTFPSRCVHAALGTAWGLKYRMWFGSVPFSFFGGEARLHFFHWHILSKSTLLKHIFDQMSGGNVNCSDSKGEVNIGPNHILKYWLGKRHLDIIARLNTTWFLTCWYSRSVCFAVQKCPRGKQ